MAYVKPADVASAMLKTVRHVLETSPLVAFIRGGLA